MKNYFRWWDMFENKKILIVGAHPDDIEFGLGGTLNKIKDEDIKIVIFSDSSNINGESILDEVKNSLDVYQQGFALYKDIITMSFFKSEDVIKQRLYEIKTSFNPDIIFCTSPRGVNSDHVVLAKCVQNVFQEQTILSYELMRGDYDFVPNFYVKLDQSDVDKKLQSLSCYKTQQKRIYSASKLLNSHLMFRGGQIGSEYAEAFEVNRLVW